MGDGDGAVTAGGEGVAGDGIEAVRINALADGNGAEDFAGVAVDKGHELIVAADDEDFVSGVDGEAGRRFTWGEGPGVFDLESFGVEFNEGAFVFEVDEDMALAVRGSKFRAAAERESGDKFSGGGVDGGGGVGVTVEGEDALGEGIVNGAVGVLVGFDIAERFERSEVEHGGIRGAAVGGEALVEFVGEGDAVDALGVWNVTDDFALFGIDDDDVSAARDEEAMSGGINFEIIPAAGAAELNFFGEMVAGRLRKSRSGQEKWSEEEKSESDFF